MKPKLIITIIVGVLIAIISYSYFRSSVDIEIAKIKEELPEKIDEGLTITDVSKEGKTIFYVITVDTEMETGDFNVSSYDLEETKQEMITSFKQETSDTEIRQMKKLVNQLVYLYENNKGEELFRISIDLHQI